MASGVTHLIIADKVLEQVPELCRHEFCIGNIAPDCIDYLPKGAIVRKVKIMGYIPEKTVCNYPFVGISKEEYHIFLDRAVELVVEAIHKYRKEVNLC